MKNTLSGLLYPERGVLEMLFDSRLDFNNVLLNISISISACSTGPDMKMIGGKR